MPFLSFIVGFRNRDVERVRLFLESLKAIDSNDFELIFIDYGSDEHISETVEKRVSIYSFARYYFYNSRGQNWNRSKCLNYAYTRCEGEYIFTSDIDFLYSKDFISIIKNIISPIRAYYFKVGFLSQKQSQNIHFEYDKYDVESYSNEDAVGALLISKSMFDQVGGYDEFYEIWGLEDNDLLHRIKMTTNQIDFYSTETIIWHIWHLPVKQSSVLPDGWVKYLKDYFEYKKTTITAPNQNYYCSNDATRPIIHNRANIGFAEVLVNCSTDFLPVLLKNQLLKIKSNDGLLIRFDFSSHDSVSNSRLNKVVKKINAIFKNYKTPLCIENKNMSLYLSEPKAKDVLQYFIKNNRELIRDFYIPKDITTEPVYLMKN
jgi:hypothetical protein